MKKRFEIFILAGLISALVLGIHARSEATSPIKIGVLMDFTAFAAMNAPELKAGIEIKLDEVGREIAGRKIEVIYEDTASDVATGLDKARKLVEHDKVDFIIGPLMSNVGMAVANYLTESRTPMIPFMQDPFEITQMGGGNIFVWAGTLKGTGYPLGIYAAQKAGHRTATAIHDDYVAGEDYLSAAIRGFEENGGKVVQRQRTPIANLDYSPNLLSMKNADSTLFWFTPSSAVSFVSQYQRMGKKSPLYLTLSSVLAPALLGQIGDPALGMIGIDFYSHLLDNEQNKRFVRAHREYLGKDPTPNGACSYIATTLYLEAVKITKGDTSHNSIIQALHKVKVDTPAGIVSFTDEGIGIADLHILEVVKSEKGKYNWKPVYTYKQMVIDIPK